MRREFLGSLLAFACLLLSQASASSASDTDRVGTWDPQPFFSEGDLEFVVTQESPIAFDKTGNSYAESYVFYFRRDGALLLLAKPKEIHRPRGARTDKDGSVVFTDMKDMAIKRVEPNGKITSLASGALMAEPRDFAFDADGNFAIAAFEDFSNRSQNRAIALYRQSTKKLTTIFSGTPLVWPHGIDVEKNGNYVVADVAGSIFRVTPSGQISTIATGAPIIGPTDIKVQPDGSYVVGDPQRGPPPVGDNKPTGPSPPSKLLRVTPDGAVTIIYQKGGSSFRALANHPSGGWIVLDAGGFGGKNSGALLRVYPDGQAKTLYEGAPFYNPSGVTILHPGSNMTALKDQRLLDYSETPAGTKKGKKK